MAQKAQVRDSIMAEISGLREDNKRFRDQLKTEFAKTKSDLKTEHDEKYMQELDKIKNNSAFKAVKKSKSSQKRGTGLEKYRI